MPTEFVRERLLSLHAASGFGRLASTFSSFRLEATFADDWVRYTPSATRTRAWDRSRSDSNASVPPVRSLLRTGIPAFPRACQSASPRNSCPGGWGGTTDGQSDSSRAESGKRDGL